MDNNQIHYHDGSSNNSLAFTCIAIILWAFSQLSLNQWASIATILAALCSVGYTLFKWYKEAKK